MISALLLIALVAVSDVDENSHQSTTWCYALGDAIGGCSSHMLRMSRCEAHTEYVCHMGNVNETAIPDAPWTWPEGWTP